MTRRPDSQALSPALLLGLIALVLAMSATAAAVPGTNQVNSRDIQAKAVKRADQRADQRTDWVLVHPDEDRLIAGSPGAELVDSSSIAATIDFGHSIKNRPLAATVRWGGGTQPGAFHCGSGVDALSCKSSNNDRTAVVVGGIDEVVYLVVLPK